MLVSYGAIDQNVSVKKPALMVCAFILVMAVGLTAWLGRTSREPVYRGKPLSTWLQGFDYPERTPKAMAARSAIRAMGPASLPRLIDFLRYRDPAYQRHYAWFMNDVLRRGGVSFATDWRRRAIIACGVLGTNAQPAVMDLAEAANNGQCTMEAAKTLGLMLPVSEPALLKLLATGNPTGRVRAAEGLGGALAMSDVALATAVALTNALHDPALEVRCAAASALGSATNLAPAVLPALIDLLTTTNGSLLIPVISSVRNLCHDPARLLPALIHALRQPDPALCLFAINHLMRLESGAEPAIPELLAIWEKNAASSDSGTNRVAWELRVYAVQALKRIQPAAALPRLLLALDDMSPEVRRHAILDLGNLLAETNCPQRLLSALLKSSQDSNDSVRYAAFFTLGRFAPRSRELIPQLGLAPNGLAPETSNFISGLMSSLATYEGDARQFTPFVVLALGDHNEYIRNLCTNLLRRIDPEAATRAGVE